jgi:hypothetical protein
MMSALISFENQEFVKAKHGASQVASDHPGPSLNGTAETSGSR